MVDVLCDRSLRKLQLDYRSHWVEMINCFSYLATSSVIFPNNVPNIAIGPPEMLQMQLAQPGGRAVRSILKETTA